MRHVIWVIGAMAGALVLGGCYVTQFSLGEQEQASVDRKYVGDWRIVGDEPGRIVIRAFNEREYFVELVQAEQPPVRLAGFVITFADADWAHVRELSDDGSIPERHAIMRLDLSDDRLIVRQLDEEFFAGVESDEALRQRVAQHVDDERMYAEERLEAVRATADE